MSKTIAERLQEMVPNIKEKWEALKKEFNIVPPPVIPPAPATPPPAKFGEGELQDGTKVKWDGDALAVGVPLSVVDPANPAGFLPAPDGEMTMKDGTVLVVKDGKVQEVKQAAPANPPAPGMPDMPAMMAKVEALEKENATLKAQVSEKFTAHEKEKTELTEKFTAQTKEIEGLKAHVTKLHEFIDTLMKTPSAEPIQTPERSMTRTEKALSNILAAKK